jgi:hypothetical protein
VVRRVVIAREPSLPALARPAAAPPFAVLARAVCARSGEDVLLHVPLPTAHGEALDATQPCDVAVLDEGEPVLAADRQTAATVADDGTSVRIPIATSGSGTLRVRATATVRTADGAAHARTWRYVVPVDVAENGALELAVSPAE